MHTIESIETTKQNIVNSFNNENPGNRKTLLGGYWKIDCGQNSNNFQTLSNSVQGPPTLISIFMSYKMQLQRLQQGHGRDSYTTTPEKAVIV